METPIKPTGKARFDAKLSKEQKELFEYAASLGGFRTLTDFVLYTVQEKAKSIIKEHNTILASQRDKEIFFEGILHPAKPNMELKKAANKYKEASIKK
jgi:uncharacterized protein (DUF1778 family)